MTDNGKEQLMLPSIRALMGDWVYYPAIMKMSDIAERINVAGEIHTSKSLNEYIQRELDSSNHSLKIKGYLQTEIQRLFNSLVIGVYGGTPQFFELDVNYDDEHLKDYDFPTEMEGILGFLLLTGDETLFAIDGQHRVVGIRQALEDEDHEALGNEEVSVIFVAHRNDSEGLIRTRRLFTTLNRYAKPVNKFEKIALDDNDVAAIITRRLIEEYPLFREKISLAKQKRISATDKKNFTTIVTIYDVMDKYLRNRFRGWKDFKRVRPDDDEIDEFYNRAIGFWDAIINVFPSLREVMDNEPEENLVQEYRHELGGNLLFRPIGLQIIVLVVKKFIEQGFTLEESVNLISKVPLNLSDEPWNGLLWDSTNNRMIYARENQRIAEKMIYYALGGDLSDYRSDPASLRTELIGILRREDSPEEIELPVFDTID